MSKSCIWTLKLALRCIELTLTCLSGNSEYPDLRLSFPCLKTETSACLFTLHIVICWLQSFSKHKQSTRRLNEWTCKVGHYYTKWCNSCFWSLLAGWREYKLVCLFLCQYFSHLKYKLNIANWGMLWLKQKYKNGVCVGVSSYTAYI